MAKSFQINSSILFLTYPQCNETKEDLFDFLLNKTNQKGEKPDEVLVAHELHQEGTDHLHAYAKYPSPFRTRNCKEFDFNGFHGNYQAARSAKNVLKYCTKKEDYLATFDVSAKIATGTNEKELLGKRILAGEDILKIVEENPKFIIGYQRLRQDVETFKQDQEEAANAVDLPGELPNPWNLRFTVDTDNKKCHFWVYSKEPNKGKTSAFIMPIIKEYQAILFDPKGTYHEVRKTTQIICLDEVYPGQMRAQTINRLCDGNFSFRRIYVGEFLLKHKALIVVCSNYSIKECFPSNYALVEARFNEYCVD